MLRFDGISPARPRSRIPICVGPGALNDLVRDCREAVPGRPLVVIADSRVAELYGQALTARLDRAGLRALLLSFPQGETHKSRRTRDHIEDRLVECAAGRDAAIVALGGGVTGDLAGFVAATWHRGIPLIQVPTTLLAMVDAAIGGKTAINLPGGKNIVGAFHQPLAIYADTSTLESLPESTFVDGFAEMVKGAAIGDSVLFARLERQADRLVDRSPGELEAAVADAIRVKLRFTGADERDAGRRATLNFGHTVAHAIEAVSEFTVSHGRAVSIGVVAEGRIARDLGRLSAEAVRRLERLLTRFRLPVTLAEELPVDALIDACRRDKKVREGHLHCALPSALGRTPSGDRVSVEVGEPALRAALIEIGAGSGAN